VEGEIMGYKNPTLTRRMVMFIMSKRIDVNGLRGHIKRVRQYQSQHDIESPNHEFWKSVGDELDDILIDMISGNRISERLIAKLDNKLDNKSRAAGEFDELPEPIKPSVKQFTERWNKSKGE
jgi:hypothetical protein